MALSGPAEERIVQDNRFAIERQPNVEFDQVGALIRRPPQRRSGVLQTVVRQGAVSDDQWMVHNLPSIAYLAVVGGISHLRRKCRDMSGNFARGGIPNAMRQSASFEWVDFRSVIATSGK